MLYEDFRILLSPQKPGSDGSKTGRTYRCKGLATLQIMPKLNTEELAERVLILSMWRIRFYGTLYLSTKLVLQFNDT
jgi:hypothetical protein